MRTGIHFLATMIFFIFIDAIWLIAIASGTYAKHIGMLMRNFDDIAHQHVLSVMIVYALLALGIITFVIQRAQSSYALALFYGAIFGFVTYGVYDFTNYATLENWPFTICLIDVTWGMFACAVTAQFSLYIYHRLNRH